MANEGSTRNGVNLRAWYLEGTVCHNRGSKQRLIARSGNKLTINILASRFAGRYFVASLGCKISGIWYLQLSWLMIQEQVQQVSL